MIDRDIRPSLSDVLNLEHGIHIGEPIEKGLAGCTVYRAENSEGERIIVKVGTSERGYTEIDNNLTGYKKIEALGAGAILPDTIMEIETPVGPAIILPDLGNDFLITSQDNVSTRNNFDALTATLDEVYDTIIVNSPEVTADSLKNTLDSLSTRIQMFPQRGITGYDSYADLSGVDIKGIAGNNSSLYILDFTPSNLFIYDGQAKFIDPWKQSTYLGSPILSLAQFITYAEDAYEVPGFNDENLHYSEFVQKVGERLGLDEEQLLLHYKLGQALQYSLSAYYRIETQPEKAALFLRKMAQNIDDLRSFSSHKEKVEQFSDTHLVDNSSPEFWDSMYPQLVNLYRETFAAAPWNLDLTQEYVENRLGDHFSKETSRVIVSEKAGKIIGASWFDQPTLPELAQMRGEEISTYVGDKLDELGVNEYVWLRETLVHPDMQGNGVGGSLRENIALHMQKNFPKGVLVLTRHRYDNAGIIKLSERDGYQRTGIIQQAKIGDDLVENEFWYTTFNTPSNS